MLLAAVEDELDARLLDFVRLVLLLVELCDERLDVELFRGVLQLLLCQRLLTIEGGG